MQYWIFLYDAFFVNSFKLIVSTNFDAYPHFLRKSQIFYRRVAETLSSRAPSSPCRQAFPSLLSLPPCLCVKHQTSSLLPDIQNLKPNLLQLRAIQTVARIEDKRGLSHRIKYFPPIKRRIMPPIRHYNNSIRSLNRLVFI